MLGGLFIAIDHFIFIFNPLSTLILIFALYKRGVSKDKLFFICSLDIFLPVFGFLSMILFSLLSPAFRLMGKEKKSDAYELPFGQEDFDDYSKLRKTLLSNELSHENEILYESLSLEPYMEIFQEGDLAKKVNAIERLTELANAQSVDILKRCLDFDDYEVRYFSNNALAKIEQDMMSKVELAQDNIERHPRDYVAYNVRAQHYLDAYLLGILDKNLETHFLESALMDYFTSLSLKEDQSYLYVRITQIYLKLGRYDELISSANLALETDITEEDRVKIKFYLAEASFNEGRIQDVIKYCDEIKAYDTGFDLITNSVRWWTSDIA